MPTRTYTGADLINWVLGPPLFTGTSTPNVSSSPGTISADSSDSENDSGGISAAAGVEQTGSVTATGNFDYDAFPAIPDNALITLVRLTGLGLSGAVSATASVSGTDVPPISNYLVSIGGVGSTAAVAGGSAAIGGLNVSGEASFAFQQVGQAGSTDSISNNASGSTSDSDEIDFSGSPITKAQLAATFNTLGITAAINIEAGAQVNNVDDDAAASAVHAWSAGVGGIQFQVTYTEGPVTITLDPPGGDVEPGQIIRMSGENILGFTVAGLVGDKVVPINVKPDGPDLLLEVPYPPTDDCSDCLTADCLSCNDCFDVCNEDLDSAECAECMAACLECLENCLENIELAEACNDSSGTPPEVDIIIICGDPGNQFSGSVPLGNFTIIVANGSGIYRFINDKTNDTVYQAPRDGTTLDIKIPNPFGKSGFFRS